MAPLEIDEVRQTIEGLVDEDKAAYLEAVKIAPSLVATESDPRLFLACCKSNVEKAAQRLARYWTQRKRILGERCFLPVMDLSGEGALTKDDAEWLRCGAFAFLPKDRSGRTVICMDRSRLPSETAMVQLKHIFFVLGVAAQNPVSQTEGTVYLFRVTEQTTNNSERRKAFVNLVSTCFPVLTKCMHFVSVMPRGAIRQMKQTSLPIAIKDFGAASHIHLSESSEDIALKLSVHGITKDGLPQALGGSWDYQRFEQWIDCQMGSTKPPARSEPPPKTEHEDEDSMESVSTSAQDAGMNSRDKLSFIRKKNALYSKRKYYKKKAKVHQLMQDQYHLSAKNEEIKSDNERLERLLNQAQNIVASGAPPIVPLPAASLPGAPLLGLPPQAFTAPMVQEQQYARFPPSHGSSPCLFPTTGFSPMALDGTLLLLQHMRQLEALQQLGVGRLTPFPEGTLHGSVMEPLRPGSEQLSRSPDTPDDIVLRLLRENRFR